MSLLFACVLVLAAVLLWWAPEEHAASPQVASDPADSGPPTRRTFEGCQPVEAALQYEDYVGERALAILSWIGLREQAADLKIPVFIVAFQNAVIQLRFAQFPMREQYMFVWLNSGHIEPGAEDTFLLDPCSATLEPWPNSPRDRS